MKRYAILALPIIVAGAVLLIPVSASGAFAGSTDAPRKTFTGCPKVVLYGVRGVGETLSSNVGLGGPLYELYTKMQALATDPSQVGAMANGYQSVSDAKKLLNGGAYAKSVKQGIANMKSDLIALYSQCPPGVSIIVVAGYSEGADVVRRGLAAVAPSIGNQVLLDGPLLFGDPNFDPKEEFNNPTYDPNQEINLEGNFSDKVGVGRLAKAITGLSSPPSLPRNGKTNMDPISWCHDLDPVCQGGQWAVDAHTSYSYDTSAAAYYALHNAALFGRVAVRSAVPIASVAPYQVVCAGSPATLFPKLLNNASPFPVSYTIYVDGVEDGIVNLDAYSSAFEIPVALSGGRHLVEIYGAAALLSSRNLYVSC